MSRGEKGTGRDAFRREKEYRREERRIEPSKARGGKRRNSRGETGKRRECDRRGERLEEFPVTGKSENFGGYWRGAKTKRKKGHSE